MSARDRIIALLSTHPDGLEATVTLRVHKLT